MNGRLTNAASLCSASHTHAPANGMGKPQHTYTHRHKVGQTGKEEPAHHHTPPQAIPNAACLRLWCVEKGSAATLYPPQRPKCLHERLQRLFALPPTRMLTLLAWQNHTTHTRRHAAGQICREGTTCIRTLPHAIPNTAHLRLWCVGKGSAATLYPLSGPNSLMNACSVFLSISRSSCHTSSTGSVQLRVRRRTARVTAALLSSLRPPGGSRD